jgi:hypothetical protein
LFREGHHGAGGGANISERAADGWRGIVSETIERVTFTPGPWRWFKPEGSTGWLDVVGAGEMYAPSVCSLYNGDRPTIEADARLIAAAPEMLATLKELHGNMACTCRLEPLVGGPVPCKTCQVGAVIAKAEGR